MSPSGRPAPVVYKFGGTSVGDARRIREVATLVTAGPERLVVVVSAMAGVTDELAMLAHQRDVEPPASTLERLAERHLRTLDELDLPDAARVRAQVLDRLGALRAHLEAGEVSRAGDDEILSAGEDLSALLVAAAVRAAGRDAEAVDARRVMVTDNRFGRAVPQADPTRLAASTELLPRLDRDRVPVVQGFVGGTTTGRTTTLGRGGSDFTAAVLGGAIDADVVHIWTDVDGILSGDPDLVDRPRLLDEIGFEEAVELAWAGASVVHPVAAKWAVAHAVPLRIRSTFHPERMGTLVRHDVRGVAGIAAVTAKKHVALIRVRSLPAALPYGFLARVFGVLGRHRLEVDLVATSHSSTSFTIDESEEIDVVAAELSTFSDVDVTRDLVTITLVGRGLLAEPGLNGRVFTEMRDVQVRLISRASDVSLSVVVAATDAPALLRTLHTALVEARPDSARRSA